MSGTLAPVYTSSPTVSDMLYINGNANWFDRGEQYRFTLRMENYPIRVVRVSRNCFNLGGSTIPEGVDYLAYFWIFPFSYSLPVWRLGNNDVIDSYMPNGISYNGNVYNIAGLAKWGTSALHAYGIYEGEILYDTFEDFLQNEDVKILTKIPITYSATNGTIAGPPEATIGETVIATGTPNDNYGITDYTTQISVTCNDIPVPFTYNATTNEITFTMPDPTSG